MASEKPLEKSPEPLKKEGFGEWGWKGFGVRIPDFLPFFLMVEFLGIAGGEIMGNRGGGDMGST